MTETLRERQRKVARETILGALAEHVAESGSVDFSIAEIAKRAGVSHRTVYNYFPSRHDLVDALSDWADAEMRKLGSTLVPEDLDTIPGLIAPNFAIFDEIPGVSEAFARIDTARRASGGHRRRTRAFSDMIGEEFPEFDPRHRDAIAALMRQLASVKSWYLLTREHELTTTESATVIGWTMRLIVAALRNGDHPFPEETS